MARVLARAATQHGHSHQTGTHRPRYYLCKLLQSTAGLPGRRDAHLGVANCRQRILVVNVRLRALDTNEQSVSHQLPPQRDRCHGRCTRTFSFAASEWSSSISFRILSACVRSSVGMAFPSARHATQQHARHDRVVAQRDTQRLPVHCSAAGGAGHGSHTSCAF